MLFFCYEIFKKTFIYYAYLSLTSSKIDVYLLFTVNMYFLCHLSIPLFISVCDILPIVLKSHNLTPKLIYRCLQKATEFCSCYIAHPSQTQSTTDAAPGINSSILMQMFDFANFIFHKLLLCIAYNRNFSICLMELSMKFVSLQTRLFWFWQLITLCFNVQ